MIPTVPGEEGGVAVAVRYVEGSTEVLHLVGVEEGGTLVFEAGRYRHDGLSTGGSRTGSKRDSDSLADRFTAERMVSAPHPSAANEQTVAVEEASVDPDPMTQLSSWLEDAQGAGEPMPEAMAVATATAEGRPSSRMVLLRGVDDRGLVFYTDQESSKGQELKANPFAAALFHWFKPVHRQVRVTGEVEVVEASLSDAYWQSRPPGSRRSAVASHQSQVIVESSGARGGRDQAGRSVSRRLGAAAPSPMGRLSDPA